MREGCAFGWKYPAKPGDVASIREAGVSVAFLVAMAMIS
jgi:hypothetical protein